MQRLWAQLWVLLWVLPAVALRGRVSDRESRVMHGARFAYERALDVALRRPIWVAAVAVALFFVYLFD